MMSGQTIGRPMEVLLVEDSLVDARLTMAALDRAQLKHRLTLVRDGEEALSFLHQRGCFARAPRPDLILLDLELPKKNGLEVLAEVRGDEQLKRVPVVVMTASEAPEDARECEQYGVDSYITKPVEMETFLAVVRQLKNFWHADLILPALD